MTNRIEQALKRLFERHRILFWYDEKRELRDQFELIQLADIEKIEILNNENGIKYRILREEPHKKFLLYREGAQPADLDNWLLDVQLSHGEFRTDQVAIWLSELDLSGDFSAVVQGHPEFFRANKRLEGLKQLLHTNETLSSIRLKILAICAGSDSHLDSIVEHLLAELASGGDEKIKLIRRCNLEPFLWEQMTRCYGYKSNEPGMRDFVIELFKSCYAMATEGTFRLTSDALVFLKRWKDSRQFVECFKSLSKECAEVLSIEKDLCKRDFRPLLELDLFYLIDLKIISDLVKIVAARTASQSDISSWVRQRRQSLWYPEYQHLYDAIDFAAQFLQQLNEAKLTMDSLAEGVKRYSASWYKLDQSYRKFIYHVYQASQPSLMSVLIEQIENHYSNSYLLKMNNCWQACVDKTASWEAMPIPLQRDFFERWVQPFLKKKNKACVIISDAMRYEIGEELLGLIRQEDRYSAELQPMLAMLPSFTQLGMAALLPNKELSLADDESGTVLVDGHPSQGSDNRLKILGVALSQKSAVFKADALLALKGDECRELLRDHDVIYIYHNLIDATGDKRDSEERVFEAVEKTLQELIQLIKKLTGANASNVLVTSDHGFIYQNRAIDESDFSGSDAIGDQILYRNRRFVLGKGLKEVASLRKFSSAELGLTGDMEVQIPKSINRLRMKGAGSRFVHGGAALQEVVVPVLKINKKRQNDVTAVEVDILRGSTSLITSSQLAVLFYQMQGITDKVQARTLRAGIYTEAGEIISDCHELPFDIASECAREREVQVRFILTRKADEVNGQEVILKLEEKHRDTSHYTEYKSLRYQIRRSFTSEFDF